MSGQNRCTAINPDRVGTKRQARDSSGSLWEMVHPMIHPMVAPAATSLESGITPDVARVRRHGPGDQEEHEGRTEHQPLAPSTRREAS